MMSAALRSVLALFAPAVLTLPLAGGTADTVRPPATPVTASVYQSVITALRAPQVDPTRVADVRQLVLQRDAGSLTLRGGRLYLLQPIGGRTIGAVYVGPGTFTFTPPTDVERENLARYFDQQTSLQEPIHAVFLLFTDSTLAQLTSRLTFAPGRVEGDVQGTIDNALDYLAVKEDGHPFNADILRSVLDHDHGLFYAHLMRDGDPWMFEIDPYDAEAVQFFHHARYPNHGAKYAELVSSFPTARFRAAGERPARVRDATVRDYRIETWLDRTGMGGLSFRAAARMVLASDSAEGPWAELQLASDLRVDSGRWADGAAATLIKDDHNPQVWIGVDQRLDHGAPDTLTVYYHGDLFDRVVDMFYLKDPIGWYPLSPGALDHATFDLTYHVPTGYAFASTGRLVDSSLSGDTVTTHWVATVPMRNATFDVGVYDPYRVPGSKAEPITLFFSDKANRALAEAALANGESFTVHTHMKEQVAEDVAKSMEFYTRQFGPATAGAFYASESPGMEGLAFPGLIKLSYITFLSQGENGGQTLFRAHEVAHQWWGIGVDYLTYHDQWLSEAFANFSALWFVQTVSKDNKDYFAQLDQWRKDITESRASIFGNGQQAGPISLGYRTSSTHTPGDYDLIIYEKGAWVLHMLRMLMLDMRTMNEDRFTQMMRDFYQTYRGRAATTADFERLVARHMHMPMDWFFREWVDGTAIPTYDVHWTSSKGPDGAYHVHLTVQQLNVPSDFQMYVPLTITLKDGRAARMRVKVAGDRIDEVLPIALPEAPKSLQFNVLDAVLADVEMN